MDKGPLQLHHCTQDLEEIETGDEAGVASNSPAAPLAGVSDVMAFTDPTLQGFSKNFLKVMSKKNLDLLYPFRGGLPRKLYASPSGYATHH